MLENGSIRHARYLTHLFFFFNGPGKEFPLFISLEEGTPLQMGQSGTVVSIVEFKVSPSMSSPDSISLGTGTGPESLCIALGVGVSLKLVPIGSSTVPGHSLSDQYSGFPDKMDSCESAYPVVSDSQQHPALCSVYFLSLTSPSRHHLRTLCPCPSSSEWRLGPRI